MSPRPTLTTPIAIVLAGGLVGVGAYLGLRSRAEPTAPTEAPQATATDVAPPGASTAPAPESPEAEASRRASVAAKLQQELDARHPTFRATCWEAAAKDLPEPRSYRATFVFTFDADGRQVSRGVEEDRSSSRVTLANCLNGLMPAFELGPEAAGLAAVEATVAFP